MQEFQIRRWCDVCFAEDETKVEAIFLYHINVRLGKGVSRGLERTLELCELHSKPVEELRETMRVCGTAPGTPPGAAPKKAEVKEALRRPPEESKPEPEKKTPLKPYPSSLKNKPCPLCGKLFASRNLKNHLVDVHKAPRPRIPVNCPDCGKHIARGPAMVVHRSRAHGYDSIAELVSRMKVKK